MSAEALPAWSITWNPSSESSLASPSRRSTSFATAGTGSVAAAVPLLLVVGFASIIFLTTGNSTIQLLAEPSYRGRITALWSTAFVGSTPIGATIIGAIGASSPRLAVTVGGAACGVAAITGLAILAHSKTSTRLTPRLGRG